MKSGGHCRIQKDLVGNGLGRILLLRVRLCWCRQGFPMPWARNGRGNLTIQSRRCIKGLSRLDIIVSFFCFRWDVGMWNSPFCMLTILRGLGRCRSESFQRVQGWILEAWTWTLPIYLLINCHPSSMYSRPTSSNITPTKWNIAELCACFWNKMVSFCISAIYSPLYRWVSICCPSKKGPRNNGVITYSTFTWHLLITTTQLGKQIYMERKYGRCIRYSRISTSCYIFTSNDIKYSNI